MAPKKGRPSQPATPAGSPEAALIGSTGTASSRATTNGGTPSPAAAASNAPQRFATSVETGTGAGTGGASAESATAARSPTEVVADSSNHASVLILQELANLRKQVQELVAASQCQADLHSKVLQVVSGGERRQKQDVQVEEGGGAQPPAQNPDVAGGPHPPPATWGPPEPRNEEFAGGKAGAENTPFITATPSSAMRDMDCKAATADGKKGELKNIFMYVENAEEEAEKLRPSLQQQIEIGIDASMGFVISCNAIFLGIQMDAKEGDPGVVAVNFIFYFIFVAELVAKVRIHGFRGQFGPGQYSNRFDASLVLIDTIFLILSFAKVDAGSGITPFLRMFRLAKIARLVRLLRAEIFSDLLMMIQGMIGGMTTLGWAMVLFLLVMYVLSLIFRALWGENTLEHVSEFFDTVPKSFITTFRCGFGDCSTAGGMPIFPWVQEEHGVFSPEVGFFVFFVFLISVGLFNVISAIFVESTMKAANDIMCMKKKERLSDMQLWASSITTLVRCIMSVEKPGTAVPHNLSEYVETVVSLDVTNDVIDKVVMMEDAKDALAELDIDPEDNMYLSDILDPDNGGSITILDLVDGIRRLRGDPRRSDIVSIDLMIRSIQSNVDKLVEKLAPSDVEV